MISVYADEAFTHAPGTATMMFLPVKVEKLMVLSLYRQNAIRTASVTYGSLTLTVVSGKASPTLLGLTEAREATAL
jgi:hypothetical protein